MGWRKGEKEREGQSEEKGGEGGRGVEMRGEERSEGER